MGNELPTIPERICRGKVQNFFGGLFPKTPSDQKLLTMLRGLVVPVSIFMLVFPVLLFLTSLLEKGILLLSPALPLMFLGGIVGLTITRAR
jgi:Cu/Ag efflux pump CusA